MLEVVLFMKDKTKIMLEYEDAFKEPKKKKSIFLGRDEAIEMLNDWLGRQTEEKKDDEEKQH